jgi:SAM-dependent methyltransferase
MANSMPRLYTEFADWFHLLTAPADHAEEAELYLRALTEAGGSKPRTLLELGSGGGNNASHLKRHVQATLVDLSPQMLALSQRLNPECEHVTGDMRSVRLGRTFDAVFIQDALAHLTTEDDLRQALATAYVHCKPGGVALLAPDFVRETFTAGTAQGGHDGGSRAFRYLGWVWDPDPSDATYIVDFAYLFHEVGQPTRSAYDQHICGLFGRAEWLRLLEDVGFHGAVRPFEHSELPKGAAEIFLGVKPRWPRGA